MVKGIIKQQLPICLQFINISLFFNCCQVIIKPPNIEKNGKIALFLAYIRPRVIILLAFVAGFIIIHVCKF